MECVRYEGAIERKSKILDIIRTFELPNNPLDDIIDLVNKVFLCCIYIYMIYVM